METAETAAPPPDVARLIAVGMLAGEAAAGFLLMFVFMGLSLYGVYEGVTGPAVQFAFSALASAFGAGLSGVGAAWVWHSRQPLAGLLGCLGAFLASCILCWCFPGMALGFGASMVLVVVQPPAAEG